PPFYIQISECNPEQLAADSAGNQLSLTISPASGQWVVTTDDGGDARYMDGAIAPVNGPTDMAVKFLIAHPDAQGNILRDPPSWDIFSRSGIKVRYQVTNTAPGDNETQQSGIDNRGDPVSNFKVSLAKLPTDNSEGVAKWLIPLKVKLGMTKAG
ncbi:hypothetical protein, partial [Serratia marcescens]|uniref:hypothetical protein n=1 Tax=Serratia marcescens TaxID=615 RepID=UPI001652E8FE